MEANNDRLTTQRPFNGLWSGTTRVGRYQKRHSPTHTHPDHRASFIIFLHLQRSMASSLFNLRAWQSSRTTSPPPSFLYAKNVHSPLRQYLHKLTQSTCQWVHVPGTDPKGPAVPQLITPVRVVINSTRLCCVPAGFPHLPHKWE